MTTPTADRGSFAIAIIIPLFILAVAGLGYTLYTASSEKDMNPTATPEFVDENRLTKISPEPNTVKALAEPVVVKSLAEVSTHNHVLPYDFIDYLEESDPFDAEDNNCARQLTFTLISDINIAGSQTNTGADQTSSPGCGGGFQGAWYKNDDQWDVVGHQNFFRCQDITAVYAEFAPDCQDENGQMIANPKGPYEQ